MNQKEKITIKEIAEELDCGMRAFVHKTTGQFLFFPDSMSIPHSDINFWSEEVEKFEKNTSDYFEFRKWSSSESYKMMIEFAEQLPGDSRLRAKLLTALNHKKPFREFKAVIDNSGNMRQKWFKWKEKWQQDFVFEQLRINRIFHE